MTHADRVARLRGGGTCTAAELAVMVGPDTARFMLLRARPGSKPVLDLAALRTATDANPAFRVRYAHARLRALARHAAAVGIEPGDGPDGGREPDRVELVHPRELELLDLLSDYDLVVGRNEPHRLARHLESVAEACARVGVCCRVLPLGDEPITDQHRARVALCDAARRVLADGLRLLGIDAPERM